MLRIRQRWIVLLVFIASSFLILGLGTSQPVAAANADDQLAQETGCDLLEIPSLEDEEFDLSTLDDKYAKLRKLRRTLEYLIPAQKSLVDENQKKLERLRATLSNIDSSLTNPFGLDAANREIIKIDGMISESTDALKSPSLSPEERTKLSDTIKNLNEEKRDIQAFVEKLQSEQRSNDRKKLSIPVEIENAEREFEESQKCNAYLQNLSTLVEQKTISVLIPESQKVTSAYGCL